MTQAIEERTLEEIQETHAGLRLIFPRAEEAMAKSLSLYGQLSPVVCAKTDAGLELIDGFKRLRACRRLSQPTIRVTLLETTTRGSKAGMIRLNRVVGSLTDFEEAMIIQSLHRMDGLSQVEIAILLGRDKSWVSRRISLIERLDQEVRRHLELGLISVTVGREIAKLPRGNLQENVLAKTLKHHLGKRDVEKLVHLLLTHPRWEHGCILDHVWDIQSPDFWAPSTSKDFFKQLGKLHDLQQSLSMVTRLPDVLSQQEAAFLKVAILSGKELLPRLESLAIENLPQEEF